MYLYLPVSTFVYVPLWSIMVMAIQHMGSAKTPLYWADIGHGIIKDNYDCQKLILKVFGSNQNQNLNFKEDI